MSTAVAPKGHPKGLPVLFATEMWERFNFYGMRAILALFLVHALGFSKKESALIYGGFLGLCYLTPMLGGFLSDRFFGNRACILMGGVTMAVGQLLLFCSASLFSSNLGLAQGLMWTALGVLILGNGLFKPNISSMVGQLYEPGDSRLDSAFTIFYMGINLGAFLGITVCPIVGDVILPDGTRVVEAFRWGFLAAGAAMALGCLVFFVLKDRYVITPDGRAIGGIPEHRVSGQDETNSVRFSPVSIGVAILAFVAMVALFHWISRTPAHDWVSEWIYPVIYAAGLALAGLILCDDRLTSVERQRIIVLYVVAFFVIFFWACFEQAGSSLTFVAENQTDRHLFGWNMPPSFVQNANSAFIIIFAIPFSFLWLFLARRNWEPISPVKQAIGLALLAFGYLIIALQVRGFDVDSKLGVIWLVIMYLFHTLGELCLSPIGLALVAKLAPPKFRSLLMGVWFLANAAGYALAGTLGALLPPTGDSYEKAEDVGIDLGAILNQTGTATSEQLAKLKELNVPTEFPVFFGFTIHNLFEFFMVFVILPGTAAVLLFILSPLLKKMMHGVR